MKISKIMHVASVIVGLVGVVVFIKTLGVSSDGMVFGITKFDALLCVAILFLIAIWGQIGTIHHIMLEKTGEII
ncbi:MAG: hypothetical protein WC671_02865 [Candidatus Paceibacterota bacterium]|jgi:uncharacterized membrane protein YhhN